MIRSHLKQIFLIALILLAVFLLLDYQSRMNQLYKVQSQLKLVEQEVVVLKQTEKALQDELAYANSQAMVEQFAREEINSVQDNDVLVVPISSGEVTKTPTPVSTTTPQLVDKWEVWLALFFGIRN